MKNLIRLDDITYETHQAVVRVMGKTFTVPITWDASRSKQNAEIERWFKTQAKKHGIK